MADFRGKGEKKCAVEISASSGEFGLSTEMRGRCLAYSRSRYPISSVKASRRSDFLLGFFEIDAQMVILL